MRTACAVRLSCVKNFYIPKYRFPIRCIQPEASARLIIHPCSKRNFAIHISFQNRTVCNHIDMKTFSCRHRQRPFQFHLIWEHLSAPFCHADSGFKLDPAASKINQKIITDCKCFPDMYRNSNARVIPGYLDVKGKAARFTHRIQQQRTKIVRCITFA